MLSWIENEIIDGVVKNSKRVGKIIKCKTRVERIEAAKRYVVAQAREAKVKLTSDDLDSISFKILRTINA